MVGTTPVSGASSAPARPDSAAPTAKVTEYTRLGLMPSASAISGFCIVPRAIRPQEVRSSTQRMASASTTATAMITSV